MIIDHIHHYKKYNYSPIQTEALSFLHNIINNPTDFPIGEKIIFSPNIFGKIDAYTTKSYTETFWETHKKYCDIQCILEGEEIIQWHPQSELIPQIPYGEEKDLEIYEDAAYSSIALHLRPGLFAIFSPQDGHRPQIALNNTPQSVKKLVIKYSA